MELEKLDGGAGIFVSANSLADWNSLHYQRTAEDAIGGLEADDLELTYVMSRQNLETCLGVYLNHTQGVVSEWPGGNPFVLQQFVDTAPRKLVEIVLAVEQASIDSIEEARKFFQDAAQAGTAVFQAIGFTPIPPYYASSEDFLAAMIRVREWLALVRHVGTPILGMPRAWVDPIMQALGEDTD